MITGIVIAAVLVGGVGLFIGLFLGCLLYTSDAADEL